LLASSSELGRDAFRILAGEIVPDRLDDREVRQRELRLAAPAGEDGAVEPACALRELGREPGLAHSGVAAERDEAAVTTAGPEEPVPEDEQLLAAADEVRAENTLQHSSIVPSAASRSGTAPVDPLQVRAVRGKEVAERVAAELLARRARELPRDTRLGD